MTVKNKERFWYVQCGIPKFYNPSEHLAINEMTVLFKGKAAFKQYIPKKKKCFRIKIY
jgi:hypothetical protein